MSTEGKKLVATISKSDIQEIRVVRQTFKGKEYVDVRLYVLPESEYGDAEASQEWIPTKKGVCLPLELAQEVAEAIQRAAQEES